MQEQNLSPEQVNSLYIKFRKDTVVQLQVQPGGGTYCRDVIKKGKKFRHVSAGTLFCLARIAGIDGYKDMYFNFRPEDVLFTN
ncbi:hypothetical protein [Paenibacillus sp. ACRRY]|uniref:hypothetical protein n=1 Tax=Paenibacillus sp. ACRRY TaxID=2918208 RepID=UPI001EF5C8C7|nr:hypothetical protein [Paenibacillus sp. ACRRY]MCG7385074.1 hypothetical protein [Paenibacillus sp. ACRRY]